MHYLTYFSEKTSLIYTWSSFSLSSAGKSLELTWHISVSHVFPFNSQHKCFSSLDSTAWVSFMKAKQCLSALLITRPKDCWSPPACLWAKQGLPELGPMPFLFVWLNWSADKLHPDSKHSSASSASQYFSLPKDQQCHAHLCAPAGWAWLSVAVRSRYRDTAWMTEAQYFVSMLKCFKE